MPVLTAVRKNAWLRAFYERLRAAGKPPKLALVAALRKLMHAVIELPMATGIAGSQMATSLQSPEMSVVISKDLNGPGTRFVNSQLESGGAFARAVLSVLGGVTSAVAPLPAELDPATLTDFAHGGVTSVDATVSWLVSEVLRLYPQGSRFLLIVEDSWAKPSDVPDSKGDQRLQLSEKDCLVYALGSDQLSELALKNLFRRVRSFFFSGFIIDSTILSTIPAGGIAAPDLARHVKRAFVSAFDRDGVIVADWD